MLRKKSAPQAATASRDPEFLHLPDDVCYLDSACQTMRPRRVIDAEADYYLHTNACGGRVKYGWGQDVDRKVRATRDLLLHLAGKSAKEYVVAFTLNTTYGINLVLHQLPAAAYMGIVTTDIEHNSVFVPSIAWAKRHAKKRLVLARAEDGSIPYTRADLERAVVLVNSVSNIDGRSPGNLPELARDVHAAGGLLLVDAAQGFAHGADLLRRTDFDAAFGSGHKMYGPSIGFVIIRRSLLSALEPFFLGGGTVSDVTNDGYTLLRDGDEEPHAVLEPGLQNWAGILGLGEAVRWLQDSEVRHRAQEALLAEELFAAVGSMPRVRLLNTRPSPIVSFSVDGLDAHRLALYLDAQKIMCRSGYFCCHASLLHRRALPPQLRASLGVHNTIEDVRRFRDVLAKILSSL